jgi:hypothetical protein
MKPAVRLQAVNNRYYWILHTVDKSILLGPVCKELSVKHVQEIAIKRRWAELMQLVESQKTCRVGLLQ